MRLRPIIGWAVFFFLIAIIVEAVPSPTAALYFFNGKRLANSRQYEAAANAYKKAAELNPKFARAYVELGSIYLILKNYNEAETAFKNAMNAQEDSCAACGLGMVYRLQGKHDEAEAILRRAVDLDPNDICPHHEIGRLYYDEEEYSKAAAAFSREVKIHPSVGSSHFLANSVYYTGDAKRSIELYQQVIRLNPNYQYVYNDLARAYNVSGQHTEAIKAYMTSLKFDREDPVAHFGLGFTHLIMGNLDEAYRQYEALLSLDAKMAGQLLFQIKRRTPPDYLSQRSQT